MKRSFASLLVIAAFAASAAICVASRAAAQGQPLSPAEIQDLTDRVVTNQRHDDQMLDQFERVEHNWIRKPGANPPPTQETLSRILPTGTGIMRLPLAAPGKPANAAAYHDQLEYLATVLTEVANPDATELDTLERYRKRQKERADMVSNVGNAFHFSWLGRETRDGHQLVKLQMDPNPDFHPSTVTSQVLTHVRAIAWIDESTAQVVHLEAQVISDVYFAAGIVGKIYRGGRFVMDQSEVSPGIWEPVRYEYNFDGRKFVFGFGDHETTEFSQYRRVGPPAEELQAVRNELNTPAADPARP
ncbi:MAG: hypothetical protein WA871_05075 [Candidatus Acidiferrales bacterium]